MFITQTFVLTHRCSGTSHSELLLPVAKPLPIMYQFQSTYAIFTYLVGISKGGQFWPQIKMNFLHLNINAVIDVNYDQLNIQLLPFQKLQGTVITTIMLTLLSPTVNIVSSVPSWLS